MVLSHLEANLESLQAVTLTGAKYVIPDSFSQTIVFDSTDLAPFIETFEFDTLFVRVGEDGTFIMGDDFHVHFLAHATVDGNTVSDLLDELENRYPGIRFRVIDEQGQVRQHMKIFVNESAVHDLATAVTATDEVTIMQALSGG